MKHTLPLALSIAMALTVVGCSKTDTAEVAKTAPVTPAETEITTTPVEINPFFAESPLYMQFPQFDKVENSHFVPAFERGMKEQIVEIEALASQSEAPTLDNTLIPLERSGADPQPCSQGIFRPDIS